jgi:hypothetical protein
MELGMEAGISIDIMRFEEGDPAHFAGGEIPVANLSVFG